MLPSATSNGIAPISSTDCVTNSQTVSNSAAKSKSDRSKSNNSTMANSILGRNLEPWRCAAGPATGTGMSPLDVLPPDLPDDMPDDDYYECGSSNTQRFDHFGTFQEYGSVADQYSHDEDYNDDLAPGVTVGTQRGCLDMLGYASRPTTLNTSDQQLDAEDDSVQSGQ